MPECYICAIIDGYATLGGFPFNGLCLSPFSKLAYEFQHRSLWQIVGIYIGGAWMALQVVDILVDNVGLPAWFPGFAIALLVIGLPIVVATALVQQVGAAPHVPAVVGTDAGPAAPVTRVQSLFTWRRVFAGGVGALALWGIVAGGYLLVRPAQTADWFASATGTAVPAPLRSIAVLPFDMRSEETQDRYFAQGMHDDLLTRLARIDSLTVISRTSVAQYAGTTKTIRTIAEELGVATVLEGGVQRVGNRIRVNVQLIDAATDRHLWGDTYDEELTAANVFAIQSDLAREIATALQATLSPDVAERLRSRPTESLEAYELYSRGRYVYQTRGVVGQGLPEVRELYEQALEADPAFALAWVGLAEVQLSGWNVGIYAPETASAAARAAVDSALRLDPGLAEAHSALARLEALDGDVDAAGRSFLKALELNPGSADVHSRYAAFVEGRGDFERAETEARRAVELDPRSLSPRHGLADRLFFAGRFQESIDESMKTLQMEPEDWYSWYNIGWGRAMLDGQSGAATVAFRLALALNADAEWLRSGIAFSFARAGVPDSALHYIEGSSEITYDPALVHYELGDSDRAFRIVEAALRYDPSQFGRLRYDPSAARLRADPRYEPLVRRLGLARSSRAGRGLLGQREQTADDPYLSRD